VLAVNLRGAFLCAQRAFRDWLTTDRWGSVINVSSVHQIIPKPRFVGYSVSKGGMQNLTHTLALEYAARGIRVNGIGPGATVTPIDRAWIDDPVKRAAVESHIPMRRAGDASEMAAAVAFLCSDDAAYITGQTLFVDGGRPGTAPAEWLVAHGVALTGCDTWSYGPVPAEDPDAPFVVPQTPNTRHGVVVENLRLADLVAAGVSEFLLVVAHAKLRGATGAWVAPLAVV
jgi:hypothetical protein